MERRVLLAISLSFLVLYLYQTYLAPPPPVPPRQGAQRPAGAPPASPAGSGPAVEPAAPAPAAPSPAAAAPVEAERPQVADNSEREIVVDTPAVRAVFSNRGAVLTSYQLKDYRENGKPIELVARRPNWRLPYTLKVDDEAATRRLAEAMYRASSTSPLTLTSAGSLSFEYRDDLVSARKEFRFDPQHPYVIGFTADVQMGGRPVNATIQWGPGPASVLFGSDSYRQGSGLINARDGDTERTPPTQIAEHPTREGLYDFTGVDDHYFLSVAVPRGRNVRVEYDVAEIPPSTAEGTPQSLIAYGVRFAGSPRGEFYFGPKDIDTLRATHPELVRAIHFGVFDWLVVPLLASLKWINGYVGNYGWSIIIMTALINLLMFPLRHKSVVSMRKMQEIQPEMKAIQDRYAKLKLNDPARQKMNTEMMALYRERGVNPASGCMPMLLTMPVLFAFYSLLSVAIEIRGAPFVGWIMDLSRHDPYYVTPLLMGATMLWQQRMTPSTADPVQQKVLLFMPIMFTFMFLWAPSGLVLYWTVSNLFAIGQQIVTNRMIGPPVPRVARPPAERKVKRVGSSRTNQAAEKYQD